MLPVVFGLDEAYILQAFVVMYSILLHSDCREGYHFILLSKDNIGDRADEFVNILSKRYENFTLSIKRVREKEFDGAKIYNRHLSQSAYFRLLIPELVQEYDICVYLDCDVLVQMDLKELFETNMEGFYLAGVRDCHLSLKSDDFKILKHQIEMQLPSAENYINSGVMIMNLKKMREDKLVSQFLNQVRQRNPYEDQDVINICCYGSIKILPLKYNVFHHYSGNTIKQLFESSYSREEFAFDWPNPCILHMAEKYKPWINRKYKGADRWWQLAEVYHESQCYLALSHTCREAGDDLTDMKNIFNICSGRRVILWGFSGQGRDVCEVFLRRGIWVCAFCDSDVRKQGKTYKGIPIMDYKEIKDKNSEIAWIVTCKNAYQDVYKQLIDSGVEDQNIFHFTYNSRNKKDYLVLDPRYYEEELQIISLCENDISKMTDEEYLSYLHQMIDEEDLGEERYRYFYIKYRFDLWLKA